MPDYKQVIIINKGLKMRCGKQIAQGAHGSHMALGFSWPLTTKLFRNLWTKFRWLANGHKKIAVSAIDDAELLLVYYAAINAGLPVALVVDNGHTEFHGVKTRTAVCIGPALSSEIDKITGKLPLL